MMPPILDQVKKELGDKVKILKMIMVFKQGKQVWRESGVRQASELVQVLST
jgi:thioredoxin 1